MPKPIIKRHFAIFFLFPVLLFSDCKFSLGGSDDCPTPHTYHISIPSYHLSFFPYKDKDTLRLLFNHTDIVLFLGTEVKKSSSNYVSGGNGCTGDTYIGDKYSITFTSPAYRDAISIAHYSRQYGNLSHISIVFKGIEYLYDSHDFEVRDSIQVAGKYHYYIASNSNKVFYSGQTGLVKMEFNGSELWELVLKK